MRKLFLISLILLAVGGCFAQTEVRVSQNYVLDGETGELIQVVRPSENNVRYASQEVVYEQPKEIVVVEREPVALAAVNTVAQLITTGVAINAMMHSAKYRYHHHHSYYCPPPRPRYHHHHHHLPKPMHHHHKRR